ncbi:hypothetical protein BGW42_007510 [Actinomortierella wolfii]|nr:hypothetical protein BGW42_007510 [Actinomortierella wolfii]
MFRFKRRADTLAFTIAWWALFVAAELVASRDLFIVQTDRPPEKDNYAIPFPDIGICTKGLYAFEAKGFKHVSNQGVPLQYKSFPRNESDIALDVCQSIFDTLHVFYYPANNTVNIREMQYIFKYEFRVRDESTTVQPQDDNIDMFFIPANDSSTIRQTGKLEYPRQLDSLTSMFTTSRHTYNEITIQPALTKILRPGLMGLFGLYQEKEKTSFTWTLLSLKDNSTGSTITLKPPITLTERRQILVTSIQSAFAATGGAFTLVSILFMLIMGRPRYNPFGLFQSSFQRLRTHKKLKTDYAVLMSDRGKEATPTIWDMIAHRRSRQSSTLSQQEQKRLQRQKLRESRVLSTSTVNSEVPFLTARHGGEERLERGELDQQEVARTIELISPERDAANYGDQLHPLVHRPSHNSSPSSFDKETARSSIMTQSPQDLRDMESMLLIQRERIAELEIQQELTEQKLDDLIGVLREYYVDMMMFEPVEEDSIRTTIQQSIRRGAGTIKKSFGIRQLEQDQKDEESVGNRRYQQQQNRSSSWRQSFHQHPLQGSKDQDESSVSLTAAFSNQAMAESTPNSNPFYPRTSPDPRMPSWDAPMYRAVPNQAQQSQQLVDSSAPHFTFPTAQSPQHSAPHQQPPPPSLNSPNAFMTRTERAHPLQVIDAESFP